MKKIAIVAGMFLVVSSFFTPGVYAQDILNGIFGENGVLSVPVRVGADVAGRGLKFVSAMLGGNYYRDYGDTGYRHGGYANEYDYGKYGDGDNGYGYNHQGVDGNGFSGV